MPDPVVKPKPPPLTPEQKERIATLHQQGMAISDIGKELGINGQRVAGIIQITRKFNSMAQAAGSQPQVQPEAQTQTENNPPPDLYQETPMAVENPAPTPAHSPAPLPSRPSYQAAPIQDGFTGGQEGKEYSTGFLDPQQQLRYQVIRLDPPEGIVGNHTGNFTDQDLCAMYGSGFYEIKRWERGATVPRVFQVKVGPNFGPPKSPKMGYNAVASGQDARPERPSFQRPPVRNWDRDDEGARPPYYDRPPYQREPDFARHSQAAAPANDVAAEAIRQMGESSRRALEQAEKSQNTGPGSVMTTLFQQQQDIMAKRLEDDRKASEIRRKEEDERWEKRQRDIQAEHQRRQEEEERKHQRDLDRIRVEADARAKAAAEERKTMMELENQRRDLIREEAKLRQDLLAEQLNRSISESKESREQTLAEARAMREQAERIAKESQEQTAAQMEEAQKSIKEDLARDREALDREHKLKERALDKEHELSKQILDIKQEALANQGGDQIVNLFQTLMKEGSKLGAQIMETLRVQSLTPDAQLEDVKRPRAGMDGNVPPEARRPAAAQETQADAAPQAANGNGNGNGHAEASAAPTEEGLGKMEQIIAQLAQQPVFVQVLKEWGRQVKKGVSPSSFVDMFDAWMQDPMDLEGQKACKVFVSFMRSRDWHEVVAVIGPKLDKETQATFKSKYAEDFYTAFRDLVCESQDAAMERFAEQREAARAARRAASVAPAPVAEPEPEPVAEAEAESQEEAEAPEVEEAPAPAPAPRAVPTNKRTDRK